MINIGGYEVQWMDVEYKSVVNFFLSTEDSKR